MSTQRYSVGDDVLLAYTIGSTQSTQPEAAHVHLIVTAPSTAPDLGVPGRDTVYKSSQLALSIPSSDSTSEGWARWTRIVSATRAGRWTYQFTSTGFINTSAGGAFAVMGLLASTST